MNGRLTVIVEREGTGYAALCPEIDVASQGDDVAEARANLEEALTLFFEVASSEEIARRAKRGFRVPDVETAVGQVVDRATGGSAPAADARPRRKRARRRRRGQGTSL